MDHPMEITSKQLLNGDGGIVNSNFDQVNYNVEYIREPKRGQASNFADLLHDFAKITINDNQETKEPQKD